MRFAPLLLLLAACDGPSAVAPTGQVPGTPTTEGPTGTTGPTTDPSSTGTSGTTSDSCPGGVICVETLPYTDHNTTIGAPAALDGYGCAPSIDESGGEVVYRVEITEPGFLVAALYDLTADVDVDVHVLGAADPADCIDRGHWDAASLLEPGTYWVVVDSWVDDAGNVYDGDYTLELGFTTANDFAADGLDPQVLEVGLRAFDRAWHAGDTDKLEYGIFDYTLPSTEPRFFVIDLRRNELLFALLGTHGIGSQDPNDARMADHPSNVEGSNASSMGLVRGAEPYWGSNGYSMRLDGLEPGYNDQDRPRAIVVHGADYATQAFVDDNGYLGRSWGCPAVDPADNDALIGTLQDGGLLLKYWDEPDWLANSTYAAP